MCSSVWDVGSVHGHIMASIPLAGNRYTTASWYTKAEADVLLTGPQQKPENPSKNKLRKSWQNYYLPPTVLLSLSAARLGCLRLESIAFSSPDLLFMSSTIKTGIKITKLISAAEVYRLYIHQHPTGSAIKAKHLRKTNNELSHCPELQTQYISPDPSL